MKDDKKIEKKDNKQMLNDTNKKLLFIAIPIVVILVIIALVSTGSFSDLMGNSVSDNDNYVCEDSTFTKQGNKCIKNVQEKAYRIGDINKDGVVDALDLSVLKQSNTDSITLDDYQQVLGDVNKDGAVDVIDTALMQKYIGENTSGTIGATHYINQTACRSGFKLKRGYCYGTITVDAIYIENNNNNDTTISSEESSNSEKTEKKAALYIGDVNKDGSIDKLDVALLQKHISESGELDDYQKVLGDVNKDGVIDVIDISLLERYLNSPQSGTTTASSYIYQKACPASERLVGSNCFKD